MWPPFIIALVFGGFFGAVLAPAAEPSVGLTYRRRRSRWPQRTEHKAHWRRHQRQG